jgi:hypothetical protein
LELNSFNSFSSSLLRNCDFQIWTAGGARNAFWDVASIMRGEPLTCSDISWGLARDISEDAPKGTEAPPTGLERDFRDGHFGVAKQRHGALDSACEQVTVRGQAEGVLEGMGEVRGRYGTHLRQSSDGPLLMRRAIHSILCPQQPAQ